MRTYIEVDDRTLTREFKRIERDMERAGKVSVDSISEWTKIRAKWLAPKWTGETARYIISAPRVNRKGYSEAMVGIKENPHPEKEPFNLPLWMHTSSNALSFPWRKGKKPRFLNIAAEEARGKFFRKVDAEINKVILKR